MYIYCVYPAISKSPKDLPNFQKIAETSVFLIVFNCAHTVTASVADMNQVPEMLYYVHDLITLKFI